MLVGLHHPVEASPHHESGDGVMSGPWQGLQMMRGGMMATREAADSGSSGMAVVLVVVVLVVVLVVRASARASMVTFQH